MLRSRSPRAPEDLTRHGGTDKGLRLPESEVLSLSHHLAGLRAHGNQPRAGPDPRVDRGRRARPGAAAPLARRQKVSGSLCAIGQPAVIEKILTHLRVWPARVHGPPVTAAAA